MYEGGKKKSEENIIKSVRNLLKLKKEKEKIKGRIIRNIKALSKKEDDYYKPTRVDNFWNNNYIKHESSGDRNKKLSVKEYLDKIKPHLRDKIINLKKSDSWKIQLIIAIDSVSSKDNNKERVMHSKSDKIEFMSYDHANKVVNELFELLL